MPTTETEWVALISVAGTLASGALGSYVTFHITKRSITANVVEGKKQREHDSSERDLDRQHEAQLASQNREQERRQNAYVSIQSVVHSVDRYAMEHMVGLRGLEVDQSPFPSIPPETEALAQLVASDAIVEGMDLLDKKINELQVAIGDARFWRMEAEAGRPDAKDAFHKVNVRVREVAKGTHDAAEAVHATLRRELLGVVFRAD